MLWRYLLKNIVIIPNTNNDREMTVTSAVVTKLLELGLVPYINKEVAGDISGVSCYSEFPKECDLIMVVGGDGSVIDASGYAIDRDIPILGINRGKVGYLSEVEPDNLDILDRLVAKDYMIQEKMLLTLTLSSDMPRMDNILSRYALNDIVISHDSYFGISAFRLEDSQGNSVKYRADGMILSTPQGSTAYSLSAGGPVVAHDVDCILATPVCPHSFFNRSVIFNADECIKVTNVGAAALNISIDGRYSLALWENESCTVKKAAKRMKMLTFSCNSMFSTLFKKMRITEDIK